MLHLFDFEDKRVALDGYGSYGIKVIQGAKFCRTLKACGYSQTLSAVTVTASIVNKGYVFVRNDEEPSRKHLLRPYHVLADKGMHVWYSEAGILYYCLKMNVTAGRPYAEFAKAMRVFILENAKRVIEKSVHSFNVQTPAQAAEFVRQNSRQHDYAVVKVLEAFGMALPETGRWNSEQLAAYLLCSKSYDPCSLLAQVALISREPVPDETVGQLPAEAPSELGFEDLFD